MRVIPIEKVMVGKRQRSKLEPGPLTELKESILGRGLLHPPVVAKQGDAFHLVAGERRFRAIQQIHKENKAFFCHDQTINPGSIPVTLLDEALDEGGRFEAELDENIRRVDIPWQDRTQALAELHALRQTQNPKQTFVATAEELAKQRGTGPRGGDATAQLRRAVHEATEVAKHLTNPKIAMARTAAEAFTLVQRLEEDKINSIIASRQLKLLSGKPDIEVLHGDLRKVLPTLSKEFVDLILADPPYGIDASSSGFRSRTVHHHNYTDSVENARELALSILTEGFRVAKPRANLLLFTDIKHWEWLQTASFNMGWTPFRRPIIWVKFDSEGLAPWGSQGPRITTELIFFATKGSRGMCASPTDVFRFNRVLKGERVHGAEKPVDLLKKLIDCTTLPGDFVLDLCCGSGSTLVACRGLRRRALGIEADADYFRGALSALHGSASAEVDANA